MEEQFNAIYNANYNRLYRLIYSYTLNETETKDILQDTFIKYYKNINKLPLEEDQVQKWLMRVAINKCRDLFRNVWITRTIFTDDDIKDNSLSTSKLEIYESLKKLNKNERIPLYLYYYEGYKIDEISNILKTKESTIKMRLKKAKEKLKKEMR